MTRAPRHLLCLVWAVTSVAGALAQQAPAPSTPPPLHKFIGSDGLGIATVRRSQLEALWGRADVEKRMTPDANDRDRREWAFIQYPARGLTFTTVAGSYGERDPLIARATFNEPFDGCTPQGLCLGMPQSEAMLLISSLYKMGSDYKVNWGTTSERWGRSYSVSNRGWRRTHHLSFGFVEGRLHSIGVSLQPTPLITRRQLGSVLAGLLLLAVGVVIERVWRAVRSQLEPVREVGVIGLGGALLGAGLVATMLAFSVFASGDGYARLGGLMLGLMATCLAVFALLVFSRSRITAVSRVASAILVLELAGLLLAKLF